MIISAPSRGMPRPVMQAIVMLYIRPGTSWAADSSVKNPNASNSTRIRIISCTVRHPSRRMRTVEVPIR